MERSRHNIKISLFCVKHAEAIMMLRSDHNIFHARSFCQLHPFLSIKFYRIELTNKFFIFMYGNLGCGSYPFSMIGLSIPFACWYRVQAPVNKQTKPCILPPFHSLFFLLFSFGEEIPRRCLLCISQKLNKKKWQ